jgi:hypothetical protein
MGYVNDTHQHQWISPQRMSYVTGTWADAAGQVSNTIVKKRTAADAAATITIPISLPSNDGAEKGSKLVSVDVYFEILTGAMDALTAAVHRVTLPADGAAIGTVEALTFSYDTGHDSAAERIDVDQHTMTLTLTTPVWIEDDQVIQVQLTLDGSATGVIDIIGARANYTTRL